LISANGRSSRKMCHAQYIELERLILPLSDV
jgi:hypothetical protein